MPLLICWVYPSTLVQIYSLFCAIYSIVVIISFYYPVTWIVLFKILNSPVALLQAFFPSLVRPCINGSPSPPNQSFMMGTFSLIIEIICFCLKHICYLHFKIQKFHIPIWCLPVKHWLTQHWSSLSQSVQLFWDISSGMWFGWWDCLPHSSTDTIATCITGCISSVFAIIFLLRVCMLPKYCLLRSASVCLVETFTPDTM